MYTLRLFKKEDEINRTQIYLGDSYSVKEPLEQEKEDGVKVLVFGNYDSFVKDGISIRHDDYAYIMTMSGGTFETINRP